MTRRVGDNRRFGDHHRRAVRAGLVAAAPLMAGVIPFGLVFGATAADHGFGAWTVAAFSIGVFAGASQIAAVDLLAGDAPVWVAAGTAAMINLRMLLYSASLAPWWADEPPRRRAVAAYFLTDQAYAVSIAHYPSTGDNDGEDRLGFYFGAGVGLWVMWQITTQLGVVLGTTIPAEVPIAVAIPLVFLVLAIPAVRDQATAVAAITAGIVAVAAAGLPANSGLLVGAICGITAGVVTEIRAETRAERRAP